MAEGYLQCTNFVPRLNYKHRSQNPESSTHVSSSVVNLITSLAGMFCFSKFDSAIQLDNLQHKDLLAQ